MLGHQIVGITEDGRRVGVPWLGWTDGDVPLLPSGRENLCVNARFTGRDIDGGYAELTVADERFCLPLPDELCRRAGGAAAVRRPDRVPGAAARRATPTASACTASARPRT